MELEVKMGVKSKWTQESYWDDGNVLKLDFSFGCIALHLENSLTCEF